GSSAAGRTACWSGSWTATSSPTRVATCTSRCTIDELELNEGSYALAAALVSESALIEAAQRRIRQRGRHLVDADVAGLQVADRGLGGALRVREDVAGEAIGQGVGTCEHVVPALE